MKILLAVDGSKTSLDAVRHVVAHADWFRQPPTIELVTVHGQVSVPRLPGISIGKAQMQQFYEEEGAKRLVEARKLLDKAGVKYETRVLVGPIAETIAQHAAKSGADLLILGAPQAMIGSTCTKVMHLSPVPVLMVK